MPSSLELDALLRSRGPFATDAATVPWRRLAAVILVCGGIHGVVMATFGGVSLQMIVSALKVPLLIGVSTMICLPSLFIVNTVLGLRADFTAVLRGILAAQATVAVTLCALGPFLLLSYASTSSYNGAKLCNGGLFLVASIAGQTTLSTHYRALIRRDPKHRNGRRVWWFLYVLVTIQMAWVLRPFIGRPGLPAQLFRAEAWGNAYVEILRVITGG